MTAAQVTRSRDVLGSLVRVWRDPRVRWTLSIAAIAYLALRGYLLITSDDPLLAADAYTYWSAPYDDPYTGPQLGLPGAYLYPPPFIQALAPLRLLPWEIFHVAWTALGLAALVFLVGPIGGALAITALPFVYRDLLVGNIHLMLGAAIVVGLRYPPVWAFPVLTKLTPGIGIAYFGGQGRWRQVLIAVATTAGIAAISYVIAPGLWIDWADRMRGDTGTAGDAYVILLATRVVLGCVLAAIAGWLRRPWIVPIAILISLPILWPDSLAILLACFPLFKRRRSMPTTPTAMSQRAAG